MSTHDTAEALHNLIALARPYMRDDVQALGLREAEAALQALGYQRPDPQPEDPAWMVEVAREGFAKRAEKMDAALSADLYREGTLDDNGLIEAAINALRLALSRGHVVLAPVMPSEEEMLRDAREEVAQAHEKIGHVNMPVFCRAGQRDTSIEVQAALQARRNVYASLGAVAHPAVSSGPVVPEVDLREALGKAYSSGHARACFKLRDLTAQAWERGLDFDRDSSVSEILENLKNGEA